MEYTGERNVWNERVKAQGPDSGAFLQSYEWGSLLASKGARVVRYATEEALCMGVYQSLPFNKHYLYIPRGPVAGSAGAANQLLGSIVRACGGIFVRQDAQWEPVVKGARRVKDVQPATTLITSLESSEEALLAGMHSKTRYNIRLAGRKGVEVITDAPADMYLEAFVRLTKATAERHGIRAHHREHYAQILEHLHGKDGAPHAYLSVALYGGEVVTANLMIDWNGQRVYLHGASAEVHKSVMAPYLLHWELLKGAKAAGLMSYDWWGIAPEGVKGHALAGVTRFKKGFGGQVVNMPGTYDIPTRSLWYGAYRFMKRLRK